MDSRSICCPPVAPLPPSASRRLAYIALPLRALDVRIDEPLFD
ncbi:hypothetical protein [Glycomyces albidus]|nr:hypothetical protein [Glycomyces albidus]